MSANITRRKPLPASASKPIAVPIGNMLASVLRKLERDRDPEVRAWARMLAKGDQPK